MLPVPDDIALKLGVSVYRLFDHSTTILCLLNLVINLVDFVFCLYLCPFKSFFFGGGFIFYSIYNYVSITIWKFKKLILPYKLRSPDLGHSPLLNYLGDLQGHLTHPPLGHLISLPFLPLCCCCFSWPGCAGHCAWSSFFCLLKQVLFPVQIITCENLFHPAQLLSPLWYGF